MFTSFFNQDQGGVNARCVKLNSMYLLRTMAVVAFLGVLLITQACNPASVETSSPTVKSDDSNTISQGTPVMTLMEALQKRQSASSFKTDALPKDTLIELLWAAWGINRPDTGKRTAPSAMNAQEIDIYVLTADGTYVYDAKANDIKLVLAEDIRSKVGTRPSLLEAPVQLIYVADYTKFRVGTQAEKESWSAAHTGFIGQNVYLYCAAKGLGAHFYAGFNRDALKEALHLKEGQEIVFGQTVGYTK